MPDCRLCYKPMGLLSTGNTHKECQATYDHGAQRIRRMAYETTLGRIAYTSQTISQFIPAAREIARHARIPASEIQGMLLTGWKFAFEEVTAADRMPNQAEMDWLLLCSKTFGLTPQQLEWAHVREKMEVVKATQMVRNYERYLIQSLRQGQVPAYPNPPRLPFLFQQGEVLLWYFENVPLYEDRVSHHRVYQSIGFYYHGIAPRVGRAYTVEHERLVCVDNGVVALTNKSLYFGGAKSHRIPFSRIVGLHPFTDALEIFKEAATPHREVFCNMNGIFAGEVIYLAAGMQ